MAPWYDSEDAAKDVGKFTAGLLNDEAMAECASKLGWLALLACADLAAAELRAAEGSLWLSELDGKTWCDFAADPGWGGAQSCKLIFAPGKPVPLMFLSKELDFHYELMQMFAPCFADWTRPMLPEEKWPHGIADFNRAFYTDGPHTVVLAGITSYGGSWTLDLNPGDFKCQPGQEQHGQILADMTQAVATATSGLHGGHLKFHPQSPEQEVLCTKLSGFEMVSTEQLYASLTYQPLITGEATGVMRLVRSGESTENVSRDAICVCEDVPNELPPVQALITGALQTPLAHTALLCANRGTPNLGLPGKFADFVQFDGQHVKLVIGSTTHTVEAIAVSASEGQFRPQKKLQLPAPTEGTKSFVQVSEADESCGAKAFQYGRLSAWLSGDKTLQFGSVQTLVPWPVDTLDGFVVPFAFAEDHFKGAGRSCLEILAAPVDPAVVNAVVDEMKRRFPDKSVILRSSTNCEDLPGFNGAGLYDSVVVRNPACSEAGGCDSPVLDPANVEQALKTVWGSVWTPRAIAERHEYAMDEANVRVAVLVQPFVTEALCNGVAVTNWSPQMAHVRGVYINSLAGAGRRVTDAAVASEGAAEQCFVHMSRLPGELDVQLIARAGPPILDGAAARAVAAAAYMVQQRAEPAHACWDLEWMVTGSGDERRVVLLQARPFQPPAADGEAKAGTSLGAPLAWRNDADPVGISAASVCTWGLKAHQQCRLVLDPPFKRGTGKHCIALHTKGLPAKIGFVDTFTLDFAQEADPSPESQTPDGHSFADSQVRTARFNQTQLKQWGQGGLKAAPIESAPMRIVVMIDTDALTCAIGISPLEHYSGWVRKVVSAERHLAGTGLCQLSPDPSRPDEFPFFVAGAGKRFDTPDSITGSDRPTSFDCIVYDRLTVPCELTLLSSWRVPAALDAMIFVGGEDIVEQSAKEAAAAEKQRKWDEDAPQREAAAAAAAEKERQTPKCITCGKLWPAYDGYCRAHAPEQEREQEQEQQRIDTTVAHAAQPERESKQNCVMS